MELTEALKVIREECKKHDFCRYCPLRSNNYKCGLYSVPHPGRWKLADETNAVPKLFE